MLPEGAPTVHILWWRVALTAFAVAIITLYFVAGGWVRGSALTALFAVVICVQLIAQTNSRPSALVRPALRASLVSLALALVIGASIGLASSFSWREVTN